MSYTVEWIEQALPLLFMPEMTVQVAKEEGMPGGASDPRKSNDGTVSMIDLRIAWEECAWITREVRQSALAYALLGTERDAGEVCGVAHTTVSARRAIAYSALSDWLNSSRADRLYWEHEYAA